MSAFKTFSLRCEEAERYNRDHIVCERATPPDVYIASDGVMLVKFGRYRAEGAVYRYFVATVLREDGTYIQVNL